MRFGMVFSAFSLARWREPPVAHLAEPGRAAGGRWFFQRSELIDRKELGGTGRLYSWSLQASSWAKNGKKSDSDGGYHGVYRVP